MYKGGPKKKICEMKNEENKIQTDRSEIVKICTRFCTELYSSTPQDQHHTLKNTNPDSSEVPPIMTSEVKKTLKEMKNKAPGIDNLRSDIMKLGREESMKQLILFFKVTNHEYLGQAIAMENSTKQVSIRIKAGWSVLETKEKSS